MSRSGTPFVLVNPAAGRGRRRARLREYIVKGFTLDDERLTPVLDSLAESDLPPLWKPRRNQFYRVEQLPYLGTGKMDFRRVRDIARERSSQLVSAD